MCESADGSAVIGEPLGVPQTGSPEEGSTRMGRRSLGLAALIVFSAMTCLMGVRHGLPLGDHEAINALAARNSIESGTWLIPRLGDAPRIRKTPLGIWLIGAASALMGHAEGTPPVTASSARLPSAVAGWANVLVVFWLGCMLYGHRTGLVAGVVCAGCVATILYSRSATVDMVLTFLTTLAFACFWRGAMHERPRRRFMLAFYVAFALAMLAKAPLPLAIVGLPLGVFWFVTLPALAASQQGERDWAARVRRWVGDVGMQAASMGKLLILPGVIVFVVLVGAWPAYIYAHVDGAVGLWRYEYLDRFTGEMRDRVWPVWYYVPMIFGLTVPYMASIPEAVASPFLSRFATHRRGLSYAFTWAVVGTCFLSSASFKRPHYLLPVIPAYCLLLAPVLDRFFFDVGAVLSRLGRATCYGLPMLLAVAGLLGGKAVSQQYPELLRVYVAAACGTWLIWTAGCWAYVRCRRVASFALLSLGIPFFLLVSWPAVSRQAARTFDDEEPLFAALNEMGIGSGEDLTWVYASPDYAAGFYHGLSVNYLIGPAEMAGLRRGQAGRSEAVLEEVARRVREKLAEDHPVYLVTNQKHFEAVSEALGQAIKVVCRIEDPGGRSAHRLIVFTQSDPVKPGHMPRELSGAALLRKRGVPRGERTL